MKNVLGFWRVVLVITLILILNFNLFTQVSDKVINIEAGQPVEKKPITLTADLSPNFIFDKIEFAYRTFGESEFKRLEMTVANNKASITIPAEKVVAPYVEYYLLLYVKDAPETETFPIENAVNHPLKLVINPAEIPTYDIVWFSPESDRSSTPEDLLIAFSIPGTDTIIDITATKIYLNDNDITNYAVRSEDMFVVQPENIIPPPTEGAHRLRVEIFGSDGKRLNFISREFSVKQIGQYGFDVTELKYRGSVQIETRNENIGGTKNTYNTGSMNASTNYGDYKAFGNMYITSEEKSDRQPQNRYFIGGESPWFKIGYGDSYPIFPSLIMGGKRIRGLTSNLFLGFFNVDFALGEVAKKVNTLYTEIPFDSVGEYPDKTYIQPEPGIWATVDKAGTFKRSLLAVRPSFGSGESFQLGLSFLKSQDDKNSIKYGLMPQENLVLGSDLLLAFDKRRIELTGQTAFSVTNKDISDGNISDEDLRLLTATQDIDTALIKKMRDIFSNLITVNQHLVPLSVENLPTLSYEAALHLNYFDNQFRFAFLRRGTSFESFGQSYLRTDVSGFNVTDRFRILSNRLFFSLGFEQLSDNLSNLKQASTKFSTLSTTASYYPQQDLPNVSLGYVYASATNNLHRDSSQAADDNTNRFFIQSGYNFEFLERQNVVLNINVSNRDDRTSRDWDTKNFSLSLGLNTYYSFPLQTSFIISFNNSSTKGAKWNYTNLAFTGYYKMLDNRLVFNAGIRSTFGDFKRGVFDLGAQYTIIRNLNIRGQVNLFTYESSKNESVWSLMLRYDI
jgi:hypothetical protein